MAARSPAKKAAKASAAPAKKATKASAPAKPKPAASTSRQSAKAPSKSPKKGASKAVSTPTKSSPKKAATPAAKSAPAKPAAKAPATSSVKRSAAVAPQKSASKSPSKPAAKQPAKQPAKQAPPASAPAAATAVDGIPKPKFSKDGLGYTKDFDLHFVKAQFDMLQKERAHLTGQAHRLEAEAHQLVEEAEMGDVQFDDEGGEGDTMVVERERDLALSAQARDAVAEIDAALARITEGTYGYSILSGRPIPKERLEAIPWSSVLVEEKVGGIGRR